MGFSESKKTIDRVRDILDVMLEIEGKRVEFPTKTPRRTAYAIFDAFKAASKYESEKKYLNIKKNFLLRVQEGKIVFDPRVIDDIGDPVVMLAEARSSQQAHDDTMTFEGRDTVVAVVSAIIEFKSPISRFLGTNLTGLDMIKLAGWCQRNGYSIIENGTLTVVKNEPSSQDSAVKQG